MHGTLNMQKEVHSKGAGEALGSPAMLTILSSSNFLPMPKNSLHAHGKLVKLSRAWHLLVKMLALQALL